MSRLSDDVTIFGRQLELLRWSGVEDVIVTTGPFRDQLVAESQPWARRGLKIEFIDNPRFATTNYIYSLYLARAALQGDLLLMHGDLVFDRDLLPALLQDSRSDLVCVSQTQTQPTKDFKARLSGPRVLEVSVNGTGPDWRPLQPLYKLSPQTWAVWLGSIGRFVDEQRVSVYAEDALNAVTGEMDLQGFVYDGSFLMEVDTPSDLAAAAEQVRLCDFRQQPTRRGLNCAGGAASALRQSGVSQPFLVCGNSFDKLPNRDAIVGQLGRFERFSDFTPNPSIEEVRLGVEAFGRGGSDGILAVGGGSAIDVAKCVRRLAQLDAQDLGPADRARLQSIPLIAVPTTAGSGSEATHFAVYYDQGVKKSMAHDSMLPDQVFLDPAGLASLPPYPKHAAIVDALAQCVESMWAAGRAEESSDLAERGIRTALAALEGYDNQSDPDSCLAMLEAANLGGRAINLTRTTLAHAMSYGLTTRFGIAHGHAVGLVLPAVWRGLARAAATAEDPVAVALRPVLAKLRECFGAVDPVSQFERLMATLRLPPIETTHPQAAALELAGGVDPDRMANHPVTVSREQIQTIYATAFTPAQNG
jgi:alcohol dehydrogenase class IV/choline kinase